MSNVAAGRPSGSARMSLAEWANLPRTEPGELVDGYLVEEEEPGYVHELVVAWLSQLLRNWGTPRGALVASSGAKFAVRPDRGRMPDLTVYFAGVRRPPRSQSKEAKSTRSPVAKAYRSTSRRSGPR